MWRRWDDLNGQPGPTRPQGLLLARIIRRQYGSAAEGSAESGIADYTIHARILGLDPATTDELIASMLFALFFLIALVGIYFQLYRVLYLRSIGTYIIGAGALFFFLGFSVRAGIANTQDPSKTAFIVECILLVLGHLAVLDYLVMRIRDDFLRTLDIVYASENFGSDPRKVFRSAIFLIESRIALLCRFILIPLSAILYVVGFVLLPDPATNLAPYKSTAMRGVASFIPLFIILNMLLVLLWGRTLNPVPWRNVVGSAVVGAVLFVPAVYAFALVAVTIDEAPIVGSKIFFNIAWGLCHLIAVALLATMTSAFLFWAPFAMPVPPEEIGPGLPEAVPPRAPGYFDMIRAGPDGSISSEGPQYPMLRMNA